MNKWNYKIISFVFLSFLLSEIKIGYLNADKILSELDEVRQVQIELEKEQRKIESEYQDLEFQLDSLFRNYEQEVKNKQLVYVDDNEWHLGDIQRLDVKLFFANWGYSGKQVQHSFKAIRTLKEIYTS